MRTLYPEIEPYERGLLDVGDGQRIAWELCGNPDGKPAVFLHGGPGGATVPDHRRVFDPDAYKVLLFDQRGCGRSTPNAGEPGADLSTNTTWTLVADIERLREMTGADRWLVFGGSWGSTLGLAYAETHPERVSELILRGIFAVRGLELRWSFEGGAAHLWPDLFAEFVAPIPVAERGDLVGAYHRRLFDADPAIHLPAAVAWCRWEAAQLRVAPDPEQIDRYGRPEVALPLARIECHYMLHRGFMADGQLLREAGRLHDIPGVIVQGRLDTCTPPITAWELHRAWPQAAFVIVEGAGHAFDEPGITDRLVSATDYFRPARP